MNKRIFPGPPKAAGAKKLKTEFERFDALAKRLLQPAKSEKVKPRTKSPRS